MVTDEDTQGQKKLYGQLMMGMEQGSRVQADTKLLLQPSRGFAAPKQSKTGFSVAIIVQYSLEVWLFLPFLCR